jgi:hypothetical protein
LVAEGAVSVGAGELGVTADEGVGGGVGAAEAIGDRVAGRAAVATGVFFLATGFFGGFTACKVT